MSASKAALWQILVVALSAILVISLGGIIVTVADGNDQTRPDTIVTVFLFALSGLLGLFAKSPTR
jgi:type III secretory pathway component EscS